MEVKNRQSPLELMQGFLVPADGQESREPQYRELMKKADEMHKKCSAKAKKLESVLLKWQSFQERIQRLLIWLSNLEERSLRPVKALPEGQLKKIMNKIMRLREVEKKIIDRTPVRENLLNEQDELIRLTNNENLRREMEPLNNKWIKIKREIKNERQRLEALKKKWKTYESGSEELVSWVQAMIERLRSPVSPAQSVEEVDSQLRDVQVCLLSLTNQLVQEDLL